MRLTYLVPLLWSAGVLTGAPVLRVSVANDLAIARPSETVEIKASALGDSSKVHVFEGDRELLAQSLDDTVIFQSDFAPKQTKTFELRTGEKRTYRKEDFRAYGRFVRERFDDFAWENDRVAHRMYGAALETWQDEPLTSSTMDVWLKRTRRLVINDWYMADNYHRDNGEGADFYSAGKSRGCGGSGLWRDGKLVVSKNFRNSRVIANGPIRVVFELEYPVWSDGAVRSETKRITLDAGQNFNRVESRYNADDRSYAVGLKKEPSAMLRREANWMRVWGPVANGKGNFGCAVVMMSDAQPFEADGNYLLVSTLPAVYYAGSGWDQSGDFKSVEDFDRYVEQWVQRIKSPLRVKNE